VRSRRQDLDLADYATVFMTCLRKSHPLGTVVFVTLTRAGGAEWQEPLLERGRVESEVAVINLSTTTGFNRFPQKPTPLLPKQITPIIEVCGSQEKISAFD
jgi:hypothetical protein